MSHTNEYDGPRFEDGRVPIGWSADGVRQSVRVADDRRVYGGVVMGGVESGATTALEILALGALAGPINVVYADGSERGDSSPVLHECATSAGSVPKQVFRQFELLRALVKTRAREGERRPVASDARPGVLWILDDFARLARNDRRLADGVVRLAADGGRHGVGVWLRTDGFRAVEDFCGIPKLRDELAFQNVLAFRDVSGYPLYVGQAKITPDVLPAGDGHALLSVDGEPALQLRTEQSPDMMRWAREARSTKWDDTADSAAWAVMAAARPGR